MILPFQNAVQSPDKLALTPDRRFWVNDIDDVHHSYEGAGDIYDFYAHVKYLTLREDFPTLSPEDIRAIGRKSYDETGDGLLGFTSLAKEWNLISAEREDLFREGLFRSFHREKFQYAKENNMALLNPHTRTIKLLEQLRGHVQHGILTQGCLMNWVRPVLESRGTWEFFTKHACLDLHDIGYETKKLSTRPIQMAIAALGATPAQTVFLEDSVDNLKMAKIFNPDILTVLITRKNPEPEFEPFIDIHMPDLATFLEFATTRYPVSKPALRNELA